MTGVEDEGVVCSWVLVPVDGLEALAAGDRTGDADAPFKRSFCCKAQFTAKASICVKLQDISTKVRMAVGLELVASAVMWLFSASCLKRNTPPPPFHATA